MTPIDIHTHLFNLKYLPVAGIIRRYSREIVPYKIARGIERFMLKRTKSSFEEKSDFEIKIEQFDLRPISQVLRSEDNPLKIQTLVLSKENNLFDLSKEDLLSNFSNQLNSDDLEDIEIREAIDVYKKIQPQMREIGLKKVSFKAPLEMEPELFDFLYTGFFEFYNMLDWVFTQIENATNKVEDGVSFLRWFAFMMNSEEDIFERIIQNDSKGVSKYMHLMMDVDYFFTEADGTEHNSYFDFETRQIPNMAQLNKNHPDKLIGFVAFNPSRPNGIEIIKDAIGKKSFKGVKFYPPLGYKPSEDENQDFQKRIDELLKYCENNQVPIFAHCNNGGFQAHPETKPPSGYNASPKHWVKVLEKHPDLFLCLGHGGGVQGWFSPNQKSDYLKASQIRPEDIEDESELQENNWNVSHAALVFKLCVENKNVYCDAAYLDDLVESNGNFNEQARMVFKERLVKLFESEPNFGKRIIYGSDWHMLFKEGKNEVYYNSYVEFFADSEFDTVREDFFQKNAERYLRLTKTPLV